MRDLFILGFLGLMVLVALKRPWLMTLAYIYVDLFQPQRVAYYLLSGVPVSLIFALAAVLFFCLERHKTIYFGKIQGLMLVFLCWVTLTTFMAILPEHAWIKWDPAWKAIGFGIFLPFVLNTRRRIEGALLVIVACVSSITISGGIKTLLGGGGYGTLKLLVDRNSGLYESSTIATVAIAVIPIILYLYKHSEIVPRNRWTKLLTAGLVFANLLIPVGTEARTGLLCIAALALLLLFRAKRKLLTAVGLAASVLITLPLLPESFQERMGTIETHEQDASASTRLAVWAWTLDFVQDHPLGGGFAAWRLNTGLTVETKVVEGPEGAEKVTTQKRTYQGARAFHSTYFEILGEHGYPGILIFLVMVGTALVSLIRIRYRLKRGDEECRRYAALADAMIIGMLVYLVGAAFVGIGFQTTLYLMLGIIASIIHLSEQKLGARRAAPAAIRFESDKEPALALER